MIANIESVHLPKLDGRDGISIHMFVKGLTHLLILLPHQAVAVVSYIGKKDVSISI